MNFNQCENWIKLSAYVKKETGVPDKVLYNRLQARATYQFKNSKEPEMFKRINGKVYINSMYESYLDKRYSYYIELLYKMEELLGSYHRIAIKFYKALNISKTALYMYFLEGTKSPRTYYRREKLIELFENYLKEKGEN